MKKHTYLFKESVNKLLSLIETLPLQQNEAPNDIELTKLLNISRNTVRKCVDYVCQLGVIERNGSQKLILRRPTEADYLELSEDNAPKDEQIERYFLNLIHTGQLTPGDRFSERSLAQSSGCSTNTVREFLNKFSSNRLIEKIPRGQWKIASFDESFAREISQFRRIMELAAISELLKLPQENPVWHDLKVLLLKHQELKSEFETRYKEFPKLDRELHCLIQDSLNNRFTSHFFAMTSSICHYHNQWDSKEEFDKFAVAIDEHLDILNNLVTHNAAGAVLSLEKHLKTAEQTLRRCVDSLDAGQEKADNL